MEYTIYVITNEVNGKEYVGVTNDLERRWREHKAKARRGHNDHLYNAMQKYGVGHFSIQVVECTGAQEKAYELEIQWIADLDTFHGEGYNMSEGGEMPPIYDRSGKNNPMFGRTGEDAPMYGRTGEDNPMHGRGDLVSGENNGMHGRTGEDNPQAKLTSDEASQVKWYSLNSRLTQKDIGDMFEVSGTLVGCIARGDTWPNLDPKPPADNGQLRLPLGAT